MHCMQCGIVTRKLSVCASVKLVICDKTKESQPKLLTLGQSHCLIQFSMVQRQKSIPDWKHCNRQQKLHEG